MIKFSFTTTGSTLEKGWENSKNIALSRNAARKMLTKLTLGAQKYVQLKFATGRAIFNLHLLRCILQKIIVGLTHADITEPEFKT